MTYLTIYSIVSLVSSFSSVLYLLLLAHQLKSIFLKYLFDLKLPLLERPNKALGNDCFAGVNVNPATRNFTRVCFVMNGKVKFQRQKTLLLLYQTQKILPHKRQLVTLPLSLSVTSPDPTQTQILLHQKLYFTFTLHTFPTNLTFILLY